MGRVKVSVNVGRVREAELRGRRSRAELGSENEAERNGVSRSCVPKRSLGTRRKLTVRIGRLLRSKTRFVRGSFVRTDDC
jgi:hypothetical protein